MGIEIGIEIGIGIGTGPAMLAGGGAGKSTAGGPLDGCDGPLPITEKAGLEGGAPVAEIGTLAESGPRIRGGLKPEPFGGAFGEPH